MLTRDGNCIELNMQDMMRINYKCMQSLKGATGCTGPAGIKGDKGDTGPTGAQGEIGLRGATGETGAKGDSGEKGDKGDKGEKGDKGDRGEKGDKGDTGEKGDKGETGERGEKGEKGDTGEKGEKGEKGDTGEKGEKGDSAENYNENATILNMASQEIVTGEPLYMSTILTNNKLITGGTSLTVAHDGTYLVIYYVNRAESAAGTDYVALSFDGVLNQNTARPLSETSTSSGQFVFNLDAGTAISIVPVVLNAKKISGSGGPGVTLTVVRLA